MICFTVTSTAQNPSFSYCHSSGILIELKHGQMNFIFKSCPTTSIKSALVVSRFTGNAE